MEEFSSCGLFDCKACKYRQQGTCPGCVQGNAFLDTWGRTPCSIYSCVHERGLSDCRACPDTVCALRGKAENVCPLRAGNEDDRHWMWRIADFLKHRDAPCQRRSPVPLPTLMRLRWYVATLQRCQGMDVISSQELADRIGVGAAMVRKDFSYFGELGTPGLGYHVADLQERIHAILEQHTCLLAWVGAQWLNNVVDTFSANLELNFQIVAVFDTREEWIGKKIGEWEVLPLSDLPPLLSRGTLDGAILAMPEDAENVANSLIKAGVKGILNLTSVAIMPAPHVTLRQVDLIGEVMALAKEVSDARQEEMATAPALP